MMTERGEEAKDPEEKKPEASHDNTDSKHPDPTDRRRHRREWESQKTKRKKRDWKVKKCLKTGTNAASERASQEEEEVDDEEVQRRQSSPMLGRVLVSPNTRGIRILKDPRPSVPSRQKAPRDPPDWDTQTAQNFKRRTRELVCSSKQELLVRNIRTSKESSRGKGSSRQRVLVLLDSCLPQQSSSKSALHFAEPAAVMLLLLLMSLLSRRRRRFCH
jgi:hypothetical protein